MERVTMLVSPTPKRVVATFKRADGSVDTTLEGVRWGVGDYNGPANDANVSISPNAGLEIDLYANAPSPLDESGNPIPSIVEVGGDADERGTVKIVRAAFEVVVEDPNRDADHIEFTF